MRGLPMFHNSWLHCFEIASGSRNAIVSEGAAPAPHKGSAHPVEPFLGVLCGGLVQVELVVQDDVEALGGKVVHSPHEAVQRRVLRQIRIAGTWHAAHKDNKNLQLTAFLPLLALHAIPAKRRGTPADEMHVEAMQLLDSRDSGKVQSTADAVLSIAFLYSTGMV